MNKITEISKQYKVILTYSPLIEISGHIFECFDYYLFLRQYCKVGILFFSKISNEKLKILWNSKYNVPYETVINDIIYIDCSLNNINVVKFYKDTHVILTDGNINLLRKNKIFLYTKKLYGFMCKNDNIKINSDIIYLQDYRIYGKNTQNLSINYVKKIPFKFYKPAKNVDKKYGLIYMTYMCRKITPDIILKYHQLSKCEQTFLIVPYKLPEYDNLLNITQLEAPIDNLFDIFGTYIYTPVNRKFDCSPRLITECFMYKKNVFKLLDYYDIGLETRYNDCITNLNSLNLSDNDEILHILKI